jgi:hypothetical protein
MQISTVIAVLRVCVCVMKLKPPKESDAAPRNLRYSIRMKDQKPQPGQTLRTITDGRFHALNDSLSCRVLYILTIGTNAPPRARPLENGGHPSSALGRRRQLAEDWTETVRRRPLTSQPSSRQPATRAPTHVSSPCAQASELVSWLAFQDGSNSQNGQQQRLTPHPCGSPPSEAAQHVRRAGRCRAISGCRLGLESQKKARRRRLRARF